MLEPVDFLIHIPLEAEYLEFKEVFPIDTEVIDDLNVIAHVKAPGGLRVVVIVQDKMGRSAALQACQKALSLFLPKAYVCIGIAGGLSKDLRLGDVCYTGGMVDVYDNAKVSDAKSGGINIALAPEFYSTDRKITSAIGFVRTLSSLSALHEFWKEDQNCFVESLQTEPVAGRDGKPEALGAPKCLNGDIVCGQVSESDIYRERLQGITRNILAIETESGPIFDLCQEKGIPALTIRGISDYANASKGKLEGSTKEAIRRIAARNAASFFHMQLQNDLFIQSIMRLTNDETAEPELAIGIDDGRSIAATLEEIAKVADEKLRELSPSYKTKPVGFRLPSPRVRQELATAAGDPKKRPAEIELSTAIASHRRMMLYIPRNYPDQALPWMLVSSLLPVDIAGKKVLPVVIEGQRLSQPKDGLDHLSPVTLATNIEEQGGEYIFVINEPPFNNSRQMDFLDSEIKRWPNSRAIYLTRRERAFVEGTRDFAKQKLDTFALCDVSFLEIAAFVESTFDVPSQEAEVIALKLRSMFKKFALPAHPSFFAGIPSEALAALLLANRRSELIQLAVDGILSFVVATDKTSHKMSRGNRSSFLRRLVVEIIHEKKTFDQAGLVAFSKAISDEFDYGLDVISFVKGFEDAGLIHFENNVATLTLPFVASYLFADEMSKSSTLAKSYLDAVGDEPDLSIFDLYAEIGPSADTVIRVIASLDAAIAEMPNRNEPHILLSGALNPVVFKNPARLTNLSQKVTEARQALEEGASERDEKARVLDIADRVSEDVAESNKPETDSPEPDAEDVRQFVSLSRSWTIATILMGSGAESITGRGRQELAESIIRGAEAFLDATLRHTSSVDFERIKKQIIDDKDFRSSLNADNDNNFDSIVSAMVDLIEFLALSDPLDRVFDQLPDRANHRIIGNSVEKAGTNSQIQDLIKRNWLTNIQPREAKSGLLQALHGLPKVHFLRASLTSIYMMRTKWRVPDMETRMALLDAAAEAVRPYNPSLDKGEVMRFVRTHLPGSDTLLGTQDRKDN